MGAGAAERQYSVTTTERRRVTYSAAMPLWERGGSQAVASECRRCRRKKVIIYDNPTDCRPVGKCKNSPSEVNNRTFKDMIHAQCVMILLNDCLRW